MQDSVLRHCRCIGLVHLRDCGLAALLLFLWLGINWSTAQAATLCVDKSNAPPCYATVQGAVNAASAGDTITIAAGTYQDGLITIPSNRSLSLVGSGAGTGAAAACVAAVIRPFVASRILPARSFNNGSGRTAGQPGAAFTTVRPASVKSYGSDVGTWVTSHWDWLS